MKSNPDIKILNPGDEPAIEKFLLPQIETSMFLIGNMRNSGLVDTGKPYEGTYAAAFQDGDMVAIIASFWNGNLIVQAPIFLEPLVNIVVRESGRPIRGVIGPEEQVSVVKNLLDLDESAIQRDETDILFSLDMAKLVVPENLRSGKVRGRLIEEKDIDQLAHWMTAYMAEALGEQPGPELERKSKSDVERAFEEKRTWVLEEDGQLVAMSSFNTSIREAVQVGGVWTPPELRRNGYGRAVVATSLLDAAREGVSKSILFTAHDNIAAQRAYLAIGFQQTGHYRLLLLNQGVIIK